MSTFNVIDDDKHREMIGTPAEGCTASVGMSLALSALTIAVVAAAVYAVLVFLR